VAALVLDVFCSFYFVQKNHKIVNNSTTAEARENKYRFGILRIIKKQSCI
jgi:hypothetical protein